MTKPYIARRNINKGIAAIATVATAAKPAR